MKHVWLACMVVAVASGCAATGPRAVVPIGTARASVDFATYDVRRVGVLPPRGENLDAEFAETLRDALRAAFASETPYEIVSIGAGELESLSAPDPTRTGRTRPRAVLELARRSRLDALLATRVVDFRPYEPVRLGLEVDLIAIDTGLVTWTAQVRVDVGDLATLDAIGAWQGARRAGGDSERAVDLLSPRRIAEFAAAQVAMLL
jgi:hypothetical protein